MTYPPHPDQPHGQQSDPAGGTPDEQYGYPPATQYPYPGHSPQQGQYPHLGHYPQQGQYPHLGHYPQPGQYGSFPGYGAQPPQPPKKKTGLWIGLSGAAVAVVAFVITAFLAPGFLLSDDEDDDSTIAAYTTSPTPTSPTPTSPTPTSATSVPVPDVFDEDIDIDAAHTLAEEVADSLNNADKNAVEDTFCTGLGPENPPQYEEEALDAALESPVEFAVSPDKGEPHVDRPAYHTILEGEQEDIAASVIPTVVNPVQSSNLCVMAFQFLEVEVDTSQAIAEEIVGAINNGDQDTVEDAFCAFSSVEEHAQDIAAALAHSAELKLSTATSELQFVEELPVYRVPLEGKEDDAAGEMQVTDDEQNLCVFQFDFEGSAG